MALIRLHATYADQLIREFKYPSNMIIKSCLRGTELVLDTLPDLDTKVKAIFCEKVD